MAREDMVDVHTFTVTIAVPTSLNFPPSEMLGQIIDALMDYDGLRKLFRGRRGPDGGLCIQEISSGHEKSERRRSHLAEPDRERTKHPFEDQTGDHYSKRYHEVGQMIVGMIDDLQQFDRELSTAYYEAMFAFDRKKHRESCERLEYLIEKSAALLKRSKAPKLRRKL